LRRLPPEPTPVSVKGPKKSPAPTASKTLFKNGTPELDHSLEYYQQANHLPDFFGLLRKKDNCWTRRKARNNQTPYHAFYSDRRPGVHHGRSGYRHPVEERKKAETSTRRLSAKLPESP
jgi:hypothetical protein